VEYRTTTIFGKESPLWDDETFDFRVTEVGQEVEIAVMNSSGGGCFGLSKVNPRRLKNKIMESFEEHLGGGDDGGGRVRSRPGIVSFELTFEMTSRYMDMCHLVELKNHLDQASTDYNQQLQLGTADRPKLGTLQVRILRATNLQPPRRDLTGFFKQYTPCPYVNVTVGRESYRTRSWHNDLNPHWEEEVLDFKVVDDGGSWIELAVMDEQDHDETVFGRARLDLRALKNRTWEKFERPLAGSNGSFIIFDCCFCMSNLWVETCKNRDLQQEVTNAQMQRERATQEVKQLEQMVEMADYSSNWLMDVGGKMSVPMSVGEKTIQKLCGNRNVVIPAFLYSNRSGQDYIPRGQVQTPHAVALFPEVKIEKTTRVRIIIKAATGIRTQRGKAAETFVKCEVPGGKESFETQVATGAEPVWNYKKALKTYSVGDSLIFSVFSQGPMRNELIGRAELHTDDFYPDGFDKMIDIGNSAMLRLIVIVTEDGEW
jgi:hypothetical protein